ncbi:MAG: squalene--hopene cyclase [Phycisphaerae bacterium]|nr:squalene--hopene cyclase [Phycisphaerae bacterium]
MDIDRTRLAAAATGLKDRLMALRTEEGSWRGTLSSSALSTATAVFALSRVDPQGHRPLIARGLDWLASHQNADGGWGDTVASESNISTTLLCWAAFTAGESQPTFESSIERAEQWLSGYAGSLEAEALVQAVYDNYGKDRTFSVPILTMCALAGRLGNDPWRFVTPLPFELAALPHELFKWLNLSVVSYALPALIAMGQASFHNRPPRNRFVRWIRGGARKRTLQVLAGIQPANGGFLEAAPLTSFVVMSLAAAGCVDHPLVGTSVDFLVRRVRPDGSWPIDTDLATWVTTLSVKALAQGRDYPALLSPKVRSRLLLWLLGQQCRSRHPYTHAAPGGWAWTDLPGAVPDADDTAGALLAIHHLAGPADEVTGEAFAGVKWLLDLQNRDGGMPTFCKGWGRLPFDRSAADLTAHALAAWSVWADELPGPAMKRTERAMRRAIRFLMRNQSPQGTWLALWFGNERSPGKENPVYCTARVLLGLNRAQLQLLAPATAHIGRAVEWLLEAQGDTGGWGGDRGVLASIEETAVAADALASLLLRVRHDAAFAAVMDLPIAPMEAAVGRAGTWLVEHLADVHEIPEAPIGLYFARLWYFEKLYPIIFATSALQKIETLCGIDYEVA